MSSRSWLVLIAAIAVVLVVLAFCNRGSEPVTTTTLAATTTLSPTTSATNVDTTVAPTSTTIPGTTTTTGAAEETVSVVLAPMGTEMGPGWTERIFPYGEGEEFLGTSPGGDGLMLGPDYGTQTPDESWWFFDAASLRIAHFASDGTYLDQVVMSEDLLVDGLYFQYQMPQGLDDGSIAAGGFRSENTMSLLRVSGGAATGATFDGEIALVTTDGELLFGLDDDGVPHSLDPDAPALEPVEWLLARDGSRFLVSVADGDVVVQLPEAGVTRTLQMRYSEDPEVIVHGGVEVETGVDGTIFIMFTGIPELDEPLDIGGFVSISPDGQVTETEPIVDPFSPADPGSPAHLGVTPGTSTPWLMVVWEDGVHIFTRTG